MTRKLSHKATYQGRPATVTTWRQGGPNSLRVVQIHWEDTDTYAVSVLSGANKYEPVSGSVVGRLVHDATILRVPEGQADANTASGLVVERLS